MGAKKRASVRKGDIQDGAGPSRPKRATPAESCIKDKTLSIVARKLGREWVTLAVEELGFTMTEVGTIEANHPKDTTRRGLDMLTKWKQAQLIGFEQQIITLRTALENIGRADILRAFPTVAIQTNAIWTKTARAAGHWDGARHQVSAVLESFDGVLDQVNSGSVIFVVRIMSREGLDRLWRMYNTGELAKKLTEILSTDERTIRSTIQESNYNQACGFFDELEKTQRQEYPTLPIETDASWNGTETAGATAHPRMDTADSCDWEGQDYTRHQVSAVLESCDGVLEQGNPGSETFVVRIMSREGLDRLWRMYTTGELAKKLTEILSTDERTIQSTIPESNYNQACRFFDDLEKFQRKDEEDSIGMMDEEHKELGESSPAATASSSDPAEHSVERSAETNERLHTTTDGEDSSSMMEVEHKQLRRSSPATTSYSSDPAEHSEARWTNREEILHTITDEEDSSSMMEVEHKQLGESSTSMTASSSDRDELAEERLAEKMKRLHTTTEPCLDEKSLFRVAMMLACEWVTLAVEELDFTITEVETIETNHPKDTMRQGLDMLTKWKQAQSTSVEQQITKLCTALKSIGRADIAGFLHGPDHLKICQQLLFSFYEEHTGFIQEIVTSSRSLALGVNEFNIDLNLLQSGQQTTREDVKMYGKTTILNRPKTEQLDTWEDMYDEKKVGEKMVLLSGGAGFGKSTLCVTIANTWKKRKESKVAKLRKGSKVAKLRKVSKVAKLRKGSNVAKFELLFLLKLSQFKTSCVIDEIFDQLLQRTDKLTKSDVKKVISDNEDKVAFLMDGLDEIPSHILQSTEGVYTINDLLTNKVLIKSCVLVTTRPDMVDDVIQGFQGYARVETKGFTVDNRDKFIKAHFPDNIASGEDLISWLKSHHSLQELSLSPIIACMLCVLWPNRPDPSLPLPDKLTTVYTEFAEVLVERRFNSLSDADKQQVMNKILKGSGQVAIDGLLDGERLHFSPEEFSRDESVLKDGCQMGILQRETVSSRVTSVEVVTFLHKSHLEYCAAHYLISLLNSDEQSFRRYIDKIIALGVSKVEYVLRFCCGLSKQAAALILSRVGHGDDNVARLCLFESGSKRLASKLWPPSRISCYGQQDLVALHYYLTESGIKLNWTTFRIECNSCADLRVLGDIFRCCKSDIRSMTIDCVLRDQSNEMLRLLVETLQAADRALLNKKLLGIEVGIRDGENVDANRLAECISHLPNQLWTVHVSYISHDDTCALADALKGCKLHGLHVSRVNMHSHVARLGPLVTPSLRTLELSFCGLDDTDVEGVVSLLPNGHGLTGIFLDKNAFSLKAVKTLAGHFRALSNLTCLVFGVFDDDVEQVLEQYLPQLKHNSEKSMEGNFVCNSYQKVQQLKQNLGGADLSEGIYIHYTMSERWREELELLEETFGSLDERLLGQMELILTVFVLSVVDIEWLAGCMSHRYTHVERLSLRVFSLSPSYVTGLLNALTEGCNLSRLEVFGTNMHGHVRDLASLVTPSLERMTLKDCGLDDDDMTGLTRILSAAQYLVSLDVSRNSFSLRAVKALTIYLQGFQYLHDLELGNNDLDCNLVKRVVKENLPNVKIPVM
ncbi:uncharacterized protein LOC119737869 isoform X2 [Patiria miniata]|uniref:Uncharacterized protein n=1 Tax=Patiria miniata TaxID=46514 RepID=A0A914AWE7_PATMI|nr:uncharacterized protein LOC119737869 isoform X2 [Patiria miniata]